MLCLCLHCISQVYTCERHSSEPLLESTGRDNMWEGCLCSKMDKYGFPCLRGEGEGKEGVQKRLRRALYFSSLQSFNPKYLFPKTAKRYIALSTSSFLLTRFEPQKLCLGGQPLSRLERQPPALYVLLRFPFSNISTITTDSCLISCFLKLRSNTST
jgi:hypothetical protein